MVFGSQAGRSGSNAKTQQDGPIDHGLTIASLTSGKKGKENGSQPGTQTNIGSQALSEASQKTAGAGNNDSVASTTKKTSAGKERRQIKKEDSI